MAKRVADLTPAELDRLARDAWRTAADASLKAGADVVGNIGRNVYKVRRDGRPQIIDPVVEANAPVTDVTGNVGRKIYKVRGDGKSQTIDPVVEASAPDTEAPASPKKVSATRNIA